MNRSPLTPAQRVLVRKLLRHQREYNEVLDIMQATGIEPCVELPGGELRPLDKSTYTLRFRLAAKEVDPCWYQDTEPVESFPDGLEDVNYPPVYPQKPIR